MRTASIIALALLGAVACAAAPVSVRSANLERIASHTAARRAGGPNAPTYDVAPNHLWNLTPAQFAAQYLHAKPSSTGFGAAPLAVAAPAGDLPSSVDWRQKHDTPPVNNQGESGSVGPLVATEAIESAFAISEGHLTLASPGFLARCATQCTAGFGASCYLKWAAGHGVCTGATTGCSCADPIKVTSVRSVAANNSLALQAAVAAGPVVATVDASTAWQFYSGGVISGDCGESLDHQVLIVGYGSGASGDYWIVQNSWGADWGMSGYAYVKRTEAAGAGECGIAMMAMSVSAE